MQIKMQYLTPLPWNNNISSCLCYPPKSCQSCLLWRKQCLGALGHADCMDGRAYRGFLCSLRCTNEIKFQERQSWMTIAMLQISQMLIHFFSSLESVPKHKGEQDHRKTWVWYAGGAKDIRIMRCWLNKLKQKQKPIKNQRTSDNM